MNLPSRTHPNICACAHIFMCHCKILQSKLAFIKFKDKISDSRMHFLLQHEQKQKFIFHRKKSSFPALKNSLITFYTTETHADMSGHTHSYFFNAFEGYLYFPSLRDC